MALGPLARVAAQLVVAGIAVMAKALPSAYQQALNNAKKGGGAAAAGAAKDGGGFMARRLMARDEALQVMNLTEAECTAEAVHKQYKKYFAANDASKGGSFYLQSKVHRAKEQLDEFIKEKRMEETAAAGGGADQQQQQQQQQSQDDEGKKMNQ
mmetsp:Transcript_4304/g.10265  ORF Transcript_4304/g.10265 Transcript_4304/m.10265 type:complete len:154 (+) Transcript_4304:57-518(+)